MPGAFESTTAPADALRILLHAPTPAALARARNNAANALRDMPDAEVRIVVNAEAVAHALDAEPHAQDPHTWLCPLTLQRLGRPAREPLRVLARPAVVALAQAQQAGWAYIRS